MGRKELIQHLLRELAADRYALAEAAAKCGWQRQQVLDEEARRLSGKSHGELENLYQQSQSLYEATE